jgi:hypothetical protein
MNFLRNLESINGQIEDFLQLVKGVYNNQSSDSLKVNRKSWSRGT